MKTFQCNCEGKPTLFFESAICTACGKTVGLDDDFNMVEPYEFDEISGEYYKAASPEVRYQKCDNHAQYQTCNGMVNLNTFVPAAINEELESDSEIDSDNETQTDHEIDSEEKSETEIETETKPERLCFACRFNETIPDLSVPEHIPLWKKMEAAKRRALYTLNALPIPLLNLAQDKKNGLSFDFTADRDVKDHFTSQLLHQDPVFTGHDCGHITINLAEADDVARSNTKMAMGEKYRTLLGHFRHELGHYYFDQLIATSEKRYAICKLYFGDDELDYQEALDTHYKNGAPKNWHETFISEYATMHPYEDWAETWAHYMHIIDTLETAQNFSMAGSTSGEIDDNEEVGGLVLPQDQRYFSVQTPISNILDTWMDFSVILNSLNRSMGLDDAYPFVLTPSVRTKLSFIHHAVHNRLNQLPEFNTDVQEDDVSNQK